MGEQPADRGRKRRRAAAVRDDVDDGRGAVAVEHPIESPGSTWAAPGGAFPFPPADSAFGFPARIARAFDETANETNCVVVSRAPGKATSALIDERYDLKGYFVKAKSCDWGPMAGFVCMNPLLNKRGPEHAVFNGERHLDYLWTLRAYQQSIDRFRQPSAHPGPRQDRPDAAQLAAQLADAFRPIWISDDVRRNLVDSRALDQRLTFDATFEGGSSVAGIAVNERAFPSVAVEFVLRPIAGRRLWRLYHGGVYIRAPGKVQEDSTILGPGTQGGVIRLAAGDDASFPGDDAFRIRVVSDGVAEIMLARKDGADALRVENDGRAREGTTLREVKAGALVYPLRWRPAPLHPILGTVAARPETDTRARDVFLTAYGDDVGRLVPSEGGDGREAARLDEARIAFRDLYDQGNGDNSPFGRAAAGLPLWPIMGAQNPFPPRAGDLAYLNAVSGDYDLAAVWPVTRDVELPRESERRSPPEGASWWLEPNEPLFRRVPGRPFTVESMAVHGLFVEFIPTDTELTSKHLEDERFGNANSLVLEIVVWLNAFAAKSYAEAGADREGLEATVLETAAEGATSLHLKGTTVFSRAGSATVPTHWAPFTWTGLDVTERDQRQNPTSWRLTGIRPLGEGSIRDTIPKGTTVRATRLNPPNIAFHSDEGGRPGIFAIDLPSAFFLPRRLAESVTGGETRSFVIDSGGELGFLALLLSLQRRAQVFLPCGWLNGLLGVRPPSPLVPDQQQAPVLWYLLHGDITPPASETPEAGRFTAQHVSQLEAELRAIVAEPPDQADLPEAAVRVQRALALRAP